MYNEIVKSNQLITRIRNKRVYISQSHKTQLPVIQISIVHKLVETGCDTDGQMYIHTHKLRFV